MARTTATLSPGSRFARTVAMPAWAATRRGGRLVVAGQQRDLAHAQRAQLGHQRRAGRGGVGRRRPPARRPGRRRRSGRSPPRRARRGAARGPGSTPGRDGSRRPGSRPRPGAPRPARPRPAPAPRSAPRAAAASAPLDRPAATSARAIGCDESCSRPAARRSASSGGTPSRDTTRATTGDPVVRVPVLSKTTARARPICSIAAPLLTTTPRPAARLMPESTATGVARIRGQGSRRPGRPGRRRRRR